jgi:outer membrane protein TolC
MRSLGRALLILVLAKANQYAADVKTLTLTEAVHLAIEQNRSLKIARLKVTENEHKKAGERAQYFPTLTNQSSAVYITDLSNIIVPTGVLGTVNGSVVPGKSVTIPQGSNSLETSGTSVNQPLTQLIRIRQANRIAAAEVAASRDDLKRAEIEVAVRAHNLYFGILIAKLQFRAAEQQIVYAKEHLRESEDDVHNGSALKVAAIESQATLLQSQQSELTADLEISDLTTEFDDLMGLPLDTRLDLEAAGPAKVETRTREDLTRTAWAENPEILAAGEMVRKAKAAVTAAKSAYLPDITAFARDSYQNGVPFLLHNFGTFGLLMNWDVFDWGKRRAAVRERETQLAEAEQNLERLKEEAAVTVERSYSKLERTRNMVQVAKQVVQLREESERLARNQHKEGLVLVSDERQATAANLQAQADYLRAELGYALAWAELQQAVGSTPGF